MEIRQLGLDAATAEEGHTFTVLKRNKEPLLAADGSEVTLTVVGKESKRYRKAQDAITQRNLRRQRSDKLTAQELWKRRLELAAACIIGWHGLEADGVPAELTRENVTMALESRDSKGDPTYALLVQCEQEIEGHADFFDESSQT